MSLSPEELREKYASVPEPTELATLVTSSVEEQEVLFEEDLLLVDLDEEDSAEALNLLEKAMQMLGFYGDKTISGNIVMPDRRRMLKTAEEIKEFIGRVNESYTVDLEDTV